MQALIGLGSNLGDRERWLREALRGLEGGEPTTSVCATSSLYETAPVGGPPQGAYLNACALLEARLSPAGLLELLQALEARAGRRREVAAGPRTLDLDLLLCGERTVNEAGLVVPHPRMLERRFVMVPAAEVAPDLVHPVAGRRLAELVPRQRDGRHEDVCRVCPAGSWERGAER